MATAKKATKSIQQELAGQIQTIYTNSIVKKIDKDNFLDIYIPEINEKKGTHLFFNTTNEGVKIGFYCRDENFVNNAVNHSQKVEKYSQGLRILNNPFFVDVVSANSAALSFISDIIGKSNSSLNFINSETINISSEIVSFIDRLESFDSETMVMVQMFSQYGIRELGNGSGTWNGNYYTFDYTTDWNEGYLENSEAISVENLIDLLKSKSLEEIDQDDFDALYLGTIRNGNTNYDNLEWENGVSKKEIKIAPSEEELCEEGDKLESEYFWSSPERIEFVITEEGKEDLNYVLSSKESDDNEDNEKDENEEILNLFNFSEFDLDDYYLIKKVIYRIEHEKVLTGLLYIPESLVEVGFEKIQTPFFFVSYVNISEDELNGFLYVNAEGFYSNCYTNNEIEFIFSWDGLIDIKIINDDGNSIKIELISNDGSLIISEPFSTNLKVLLSIYNTFWKNVVLRFENENEYDWNIIENELGVTIYSFNSQDNYENWINEQVLKD